MRDELIKLLLDLGAEDLTKVIHPKKNDKRYLKLPLAGGGNIGFNFDYKEYDEVSVYSKKLHISKYIPIPKLKMFLFKLGFEVNKKQKYFIFIDELETKKAEPSLNFELGAEISYDDGLPFPNNKYLITSIQKNEFDNTTFYYLKETK